MLPNPQSMVTFTEEILNGKLHCLCGAGFKHGTTIEKLLHSIEFS